MLSDSHIHINPSAQVSLQLVGKMKKDLSGLEIYKNLVCDI